VDELARRQPIRYAAELVFGVVVDVELDDSFEPDDFSDLLFELPDPVAPADPADPVDPLGASLLLDPPFLDPLAVARESVR
jgi:hypothetical protein